MCSNLKCNEVFVQTYSKSITDTNCTPNTNYFFWSGVLEFFLGVLTFFDKEQAAKHWESSPNYKKFTTGANVVFT